ncbi:iron ABC transporter permease [Pseudonocardia sp. MH-G8]|uniref:FecCD family ABC transporter permease n=1 Tax=Pseudonocardia sp. MH-G8 TaxID=1854588 RepID=UPI000BA16BDB|nr:iron chelate uptake ABC transporter family permease subunit [Pseudonocardia sp. MH-G8]OZM83330.1 iron ABC transporter permease [Pseudonocardia sp. MH-G8]
MTTSSSRVAEPRRAAVVAVAGSVALVLSIAVAVTLGSADLAVTDVARSVLVHLGLPLRPLPPLHDGIVWQLRMPRVLLAVLVGAGLAVCGAVLQALTGNPLADPYLLGISSGASTGAVAVLVLGVGAGAGAFALSGGAFLGSLIAFATVLALAGRSLVSSTRVVLAGVAASQLFGAVTSLIVITSADADATRSVTFWLLGSLAAADWTTVLTCAAVVAAVLAACWSAALALDAFAFGQEAAAALGVPPARTQLLLFTATALAAAALVAASGAIGFVGLVVPHAARFLVGAGHRRLLPVCALLGGVFLLWADTAARSVFAPQDVPVGVVTAVVGVPVFAVILRRRRTGS